MLQKLGSSGLLTICSLETISLLEQRGENHFQMRDTSEMTDLIDSLCVSKHHDDYVPSLPVGAAPTHYGCLYVSEVRNQVQDYTIYFHY